MNQEYLFTYKRLNSFFSKKIKIIGHRLMESQDRMDLYLPDGTIKSLPKWSECELFLGKDWVEMTKKRMEQESGQKIELNVK